MDFLRKLLHLNTVNTLVGNKEVYTQFANYDHSKKKDKSRLIPLKTSFILRINKDFEENH